LSLLLPSAYGHSLKNLNKRIILDMIRFTPGGISRAEIARQMVLTRAAVTTIINDLMAEGLVRETDDAPSAGGRRPILLEINPEQASVIGIDMGATHLGMILSDFSAHIIDEIEMPFCVIDGPAKCLEIIDFQVHNLLERNHLKLDQIVSIGIGVPGPVVEELGLVSSPPIMPGWSDYPIRSHLVDLWKCNVSVGNDANFGALGEWAYGAGRGEENLAYIKVGSGVGAGLLLHGQIYRGTTGCAGEIGHITIREDGPRCSCGSYGCLESMAGGNAVAQRAREAVNAGRRTKLASIMPLEKITARDVAATARAGDLVAQQIITASGNYLGIAIASLVNLFNPGMIVVGGGVAEMGDLLLDPIRQAVRERSLRSAGESVRVSTAVLGRRSSSIGAIVQAINAALDRILEK
jgi:glucokinase-like ROK family protein